MPIAETEMIRLAELPELVILQRQMNAALAGRTITAVETCQEKCLNVPGETYQAVLPGRRVAAVSRRGKWLRIDLEPAYFLLINLGMGADLRYFAPGAEPAGKYQFRLDLDDGSGFTCRFWWFGHVHLASPAELALHASSSGLGPCPLDLTHTDFRRIAQKHPRATVKSFLLDQRKLAGIGNAYAHDILWRAKLHPLRKLSSLSDDELMRFYRAIREIIERGIELGGVERDFFGAGGNQNDWEGFMIISYKKDRPCPNCGTPIEVIKTGATKTYICPQCQAEQ